MSSRRKSFVGGSNLRSSFASDPTPVLSEPDQSGRVLSAIQNLSKLAYLLGRVTAVEHLRAESDAVATSNLKQIP
jgi:hypothetical protein